MPIVVTAYFPKYVLSISIMQILLVAGIFRGSVVGVNALWSIKNWKYMIICQVSFSLLLVCLPYIGIQLIANKLEGVACGVLCACFLNLISGISLTYFATHEN